MMIKALVEAGKEADKLWAETASLLAKMDQGRAPTEMSPMKLMMAKSTVMSSMTGDFVRNKMAWFVERPDVRFSDISDGIMKSSKVRSPSVSPSMVFGGAQTSMGLPA